MADEGISTKVSVLGDKEYKQAMQDIGRQLGVLNSSMRASQSAFGEQETSLAGLRDKHEKLGKVYDAQKSKVQLIAEQLAKAEQEYGENSKQAENLRIALNNATTQMNKTEGEIKGTESALGKMEKAVAETGDESAAYTLTLKDVEKATDKAGDEADDAAKQSSGFKNALSAVGTVAKGGLVASLKAASAAMAAIGTAAAAAATAGFDMAKNAGVYADDLLTLSQQTSISAQTLQEWTYASNFVDTSVDTMTGSMARMIKNMGQAANGSTAAQDKFAALGVSITDSSGNMRSSEEVFWDAIDALGGIANETERDALAMELFGKSAQELNPLIEAGSEAFKAMGDEAKQMGTVFSDEALDAMGSFDDSMQKAKASGEALKNSIGLVLIPAFQPLVDTASSAMADVANALQDGLQPGELETLIDDIMTDVTGMIGDVSKVAEDAIPIAMAAITSILGAFGDTLPGLVDAILPGAMGLMQSVLDAITTNIEPITALATNIVTSLATFLVENASGMVGAATSLLTGLVDGIAEALPTLIPAAASMITEIVTGLAENLPTLLESAGGLLKGIADGIIAALPTLVEALPQVITTIIDAITTALPDILAQGTSILTNLITGIAEAIPTLVAKMPEVIAAITTALLEIDWLTLGSNLIQGLVDGLSAAVSSLLESIKNVFVGIWDAIKGVFGINSPSTVAKEAGGFILDGLLNGFSEAVGAVVTKVKEIFGKIWAAIKSIFGFGGESDESKEAKSAGKDIMTGMQSGITENEGSLKETVKAVSKTVLDTFKTELGVAEGNSTKTIAMGKSVAMGINDGLGSATTEMFSGGATTLANAVADAVNAAFGVEGTGFLGMGAQSAKKFEAIGAAACKGIADGITNNTQNTEAVKTAITGVASAAYESAVTEMATGITGGSETVNAAVDAVAADALKAAEAILNDTAGGEIGKAFMDGQRNAVQNAAAGLTGTTTQTAKGAHDAAQSVLSDQNGQRIGIAMAQGIRSGIQGQSGSVSSAASSLASSALNALWGAVGGGGSRFEDIGNAIAQGVARGISNGASSIQSAAQAAARSAYNAAKKELGIRSPSRKMQEIGEQYDAGFAGGIEKGMNSVLRSARQLSAMAAEETAQGGRAYPSMSTPEIDYDRLGEAVANANRRAGLGNTILQVGTRELGETIEPSVSRASYQRAAKSATGRSARMVLA